MFLKLILCENVYKVNIHKNGKSSHEIWSFLSRSFFWDNLASNGILKVFATHISYQKGQPNTSRTVIITHYNTFETFSLYNIM